MTLDEIVVDSNTKVQYEPITKEVPKGDTKMRIPQNAANVNSPHDERYAYFVLARLLAGYPADAVDFDGLEEPWRSIVTQVAYARDGIARKTALRQALEAIPGIDPDAVATAILRIDIEGPPPGRDTGFDSGLEPNIDIPTLPVEAQLSDRALAEAERVGAWLDTFVDYARQRSPMTPKSFHEAGGLWLGSVAIARRLYCPMPFGDVWPNLYILWVAKTTLFRKTTAWNPTVEIAHAALSHLLIPQEFTPEALLSELAGKDPVGLDDLPQETRELWQARRNFAAQRGLIMDEFSGLLASARKDYNAGLTETLLRLHDCPLVWERRTQTHGLLRIRAVYLSLLASTTPAALAPYLSRAAWLSGFWPRFALLTPEMERPDWVYLRRRADRPRELIEHLSWLACKALAGTTYPTPPKAEPVRLTPEAEAAFERYAKAVSYDLLTDELDENLWGFYGRLPTQALKVATILAALDWDGVEQVTITLGHWARAQTIAENWRASVHRLLVPAKVQEEQRKEGRVLAAIRRAGQRGATIREVYTSLGMTRDEVEPIVRNLTQDGLAIEIAVPTTKRGGRPTRRYVAVEFAPDQGVL